MRKENEKYVYRYLCIMLGAIFGQIDEVICNIYIYINLYIWTCMYL